MEEWQKKESARAGMRRIVKRLLKKYKYPPENEQDALETVIKQCEQWTDNVEWLNKIRKASFCHLDQAPFCHITYWPSELSCHLDQARGEICLMCRFLDYALRASLEMTKNIERSIYEMLQIVSISLTDTTNLKDLFAKPNYNIVNELDGSTEPCLF